VLQRLESEAQKALAGPVMKERLKAMGAMPGAPTAAAFTQVIQDDIRRWAPKTTATAQRP
jgi:tripartite-type tricarboxylate transporter receptor subunit TctC